MQSGKYVSERRAMGGARPSDPHSVEKRDQRGRAARDLAQHLARLVLYGLRTGDAARVQMLHQSEKKRQVLRRYPSFIKREDEMAHAGIDEEVGVLDPFRDAFVGE